MKKTRVLESKTLTVLLWLVILGNVIGIVSTRRHQLTPTDYRHCGAGIQAYMDTVDEIPAVTVEILLLVSHGDTLGILHALWLGLEAEALNSIQLAGSAGGVLELWLRGGKRIVRRLGDLSYLC